MTVLECIGLILFIVVGMIYLLMKNIGDCCGGCKNYELCKKDRDLDDRNTFECPSCGEFEKK